MSRLVVIGSGETTPTMIRLHRQVFADTGPGRAVMLDTPFAFQRNADELVARTQTYFTESVGRPVEVARWRRRDDPPAEQERTLALLHEARWLFAGPGSPTYALRQWCDTALPEAIVDVAHRGGTVVFGSAAAVTLGTHAVPVYEIYKVGEDPQWVPGLDLLGALTGISAVVIPHFDNNEGGTHDTRFCYLGEERLSALEARLPDDVGVLGVDEHTALVVDLAARTAAVHGNGRVTVRRRSSARTFDAGALLALDDLAAMLRDPGSIPVPAAAPVTSAAAPATSDAPSLRGAADDCRAAFDAALAERDVDGCIAALLDLEQAIVDWRADTLQSDEMGYARRVLRALVVRLGELATVGTKDVREIVGPFVEALLEVRRGARDARDFATSDLVRERLTAAGVEVRDTPSGVEWVMHDDGVGG